RSSAKPPCQGREVYEPFAVPPDFADALRRRPPRLVRRKATLRRQAGTLTGTASATPTCTDSPAQPTCSGDRPRRDAMRLSFDRRLTKRVRQGSAPALTMPGSLLAD